MAKNTAAKKTAKKAAAKKTAKEIPAAKPEKKVSEKPAKNKFTHELIVLEATGRQFIKDATGEMKEIKYVEPELEAELNTEAETKSKEFETIQPVKEKEVLPAGFKPLDYFVNRIGKNITMTKPLIEGENPETVSAIVKDKYYAETLFAMQINGNRFE